MSAPRALVLGCGYVGLRVARLLSAQGVRVTGTTRDPARFPQIRAAGAEPAAADVLDPASLAPLARAGADVVFDLVRPLPTADDDYTVDGTRNVVAALRASAPAAVVYVSSTSVYGRRDGASSTPRSSRASSR